MNIPFAYLSTQDIIIIAVLVLVLFGGSRIPLFAKGFGEAIREFKKSLEGDHKDEKAESGKANG
jgi:sec-independent protein translocase protein TatA